MDTSTRRIIKFLRLLAWLILGFCLPAVPQQQGYGAVLTGDFFTHDPSRIVKCNGKYYVYCTSQNGQMRCSTDLINWTVGPSVLRGVPKWAHNAVPAAKGDWIWAPDVIFLDGRYFLYYSYSTFGSRVSAIGLVSSPTLDPDSPDYRWTDEGLVIASNRQSGYNAIDPCPVLDKRGGLWLSFGSWNQGGIELVKLDRRTGKPVASPQSICRGASLGPEASYIYYHGGYYYLFENEGTCCQGVKSTYHIMMGRAARITGPYLDRIGKDMRYAGGTLFLGSEGEKFGPGCLGIYSEKGIDRITYHYYDGLANGRPTMGLETVIWGADGWPAAGSDLPAGRYVIVSKSNGMALGIKNEAIVDSTIVTGVKPGAHEPQWDVSPTGDGYYSISSVSNGKFLDIRDGSFKDGTALEQVACIEKDCRRWRIEQLSDGAYRIVTKGGQGALTSVGPARMLEYSWKCAANQEWLFKTQ